MIHNTGDIRIYTVPAPVGVPPVSHDRKWRRVFSMQFTGDITSSICSPKYFGQRSLKTTSHKNSKYNYKRDREFLLKNNV